MVDKKNIHHREKWREGWRLESRTLTMKSWTELASLEETLQNSSLLQATSKWFLGQSAGERIVEEK